MASTYKIEGSGKTPTAAERNFENRLVELEERLSKAGVPALGDASRNYRVTFKLNDDASRLPSFSPEVIGASDRGFAEAEQRATQGFQGLRYDLRGCVVSSVYSLTDAQLSAIQTEKVLGARGDNYGHADGRTGNGLFDRLRF